jgi:hypothetical protein
MMQNFKIDYISQTASHFTTFPQTAQSARIVQANNRDLVDRARHIASTISSRATEEVRSQLKGGSLNVYG